LAVAAYIAGLLALFVLINWFYKRHYRKQRERMFAANARETNLKELEAQKQIIQLKNEKLNQDIEARNRELAVSAMSTIKKNRTLNSIKGELLKLNKTKEVLAIVKSIDKNVNDTEEWKFFEEAFNHADKGFFKKIKQKHPQLTPKDLRLCVYLRLNLSSKEIAPLLNISPRSVEIKRYRLRKKIHLGRETNLNDYFINL
ncbi:MAG: helix-turn-helix transcriptional regulator, partial [Marinirhabdus sp.]